MRTQRRNSDQSPPREDLRPRAGTNESAQGAINVCELDVLYGGCYHAREMPCYATQAIDVPGKRELGGSTAKDA